MSTRLHPPPPDQTTASVTSSAPTAGKGTSAKKARKAKSAESGRRGKPEDAAAKASLKLPSDRDESVEMTAAEPNPLIQQAAKDLARGLSDTSNGAETDKAYQKQK